MNRWSWLFAAWLVALVATAGSLFFSDVMQLPPCKLCWYQRIAMYPLVIVLGQGLFRYTREAIALALPLAGLGLAIAVYHNLLYYHVIPESLAPCTQGISCTSVQLKWLGFITIPLMSLTAFALITLLLTLSYKEKA